MPSIGTAGVGASLARSLAACSAICFLAGRRKLRHHRRRPVWSLPAGSRRRAFLPKFRAARTLLPGAERSGAKPELLHVPYRGAVRGQVGAEGLPERGACQPQPPLGLRPADGRVQRRKGAAAARLPADRGASLVPSSRSARRAPHDAAHATEGPEALSLCAPRRSRRRTSVSISSQISLVRVKVFHDYALQAACSRRSPANVPTALARRGRRPGPRRLLVELVPAHERLGWLDGGNGRGARDWRHGRFREHGQRRRLGDERRLRRSAG